jgi:hypothetical protein
MARRMQNENHGTKTPSCALAGDYRRDRAGFYGLRSMKKN